MHETNIADKRISKPRAKRLRLALSLIKASTTTFAQKYDINTHTLNSWKNGTRTLSPKGASKISQAMKLEGWYCTTDWLLFAKGIAPMLIEDLKQDTSTIIPESDYAIPSSLAEDFSITKEISLFSTLHRNSATLVLDDDCMIPIYKKGDIVAGIPIERENYESAVGFPCIVDIRNIGRLCRILHKASLDGTYQLSVANLSSTVNNPIICDPDIEQLAPVLWVRRPLSLITNKSA